VGFHNISLLLQKNVMKMVKVPQQKEDGREQTLQAGNLKS